MRVAVVGAGCIGAWVAGRALAANPDLTVTFVGRREAQKQAFTADGVTVSDLTVADEADTHRLFVPPHRFEFSTDLRDVLECEFVLVAVKATATEALAEQLSALPWPDAADPARHVPVFVSLQNGVQNAAILRRHLPGFDVLASVVVFNAVRKSDTHFARTTSGGLVVESGPVACQALLDVLERGLECWATPEVQAVQWWKLQFNLINGVNALAGTPVLQVLLDPAYRRVYAACMDESNRVLREAGFKTRAVDVLKQSWLVPHVLRLPTCCYSLIAARTIKIDPAARSSMLQDLEKNVLTEVDIINGEIVQLGARVGVPTPVNATVVELVHEAEQAGAGSPALSGPELERLVGLEPPSGATGKVCVLVLAVVVAGVLYALLG